MIQKKINIAHRIVDSREMPEVFNVRLCHKCGSKVSVKNELPVKESVYCIDCASMILGDWKEDNYPHGLAKCSMPAIPAGALFIGSRSGLNYGIPARVSIVNVLQTLAVNGIAVAVAIWVIRHWHAPLSEIVSGSIVVTSLIITIKRYIIREVLLPTMCVVCSKHWSDIVRYAPNTDNMRIAIKLVEAGCEQGHVCRKCGALLCSHCMLMRLGVCPNCGEKNFINALLSKDGQFRYK